MTASLHIIAATRLEVAMILKRCDQKSSWRKIPQYEILEGFFCGLRVAIVITGMGKERAGRAVKMLLETDAVQRVVILGVSGGLNPALGAGQGYLVERVQAVDLENPIAGHSVTFLSSSEPCFDAIRKRLALPYGLHLSASRIICDVDTKRRLFAQTDALGVDLETFEIAALCQARRIPWLALRMVSDAATESLPRSLQGFVDYQERPLMYFKNIGKTALEAGFKQMIDLHRRVVNCSIKLEGYLRGACEVFLLDKKG